MTGLAARGIEPPPVNRPDCPQCECTDLQRMCLPMDWGWKCHDCGLPIPRMGVTA